MNNEIPLSLLKAAAKVLYESNETHIEVDGVKKHRFNSHGDPIHSTEEGIRNFHKWFGEGSVNVVNAPFSEENGRPQVLYHETNKENEEPIKRNGFDLNKAVARATDEQMPDGVFLKHNSERIGVSFKDKEHQMPLYARNKNPAYFMDRDELEKTMVSENPHYAQLRKQHSETNEHFNKLTDSQWKNLGTGTEEEQAKKEEEHSKTLDEWENKINSISAEMRKTVRDHLKSKGHDSLIMINDKGTRGRNVMTQVIFDPSDVKHASENSGEFGESNIISEETEYVYPIQENPLKKARRERSEFNKVLLVDANRFKEVFEKDQNESLPWSQRRLENLRNLVNSGTKIDAYPEVGIDDFGNRLSVNDGRHRISHAAELGLKIPVSVREEDLEKVKQKLM